MLMHSLHQADAITRFQVFGEQQEIGPQLLHQSQAFILCCCSSHQTWSDERSQTDSSQRKAIAHRHHNPVTLQQILAGLDRLGDRGRLKRTFHDAMTTTDPLHF